MLAIDSSVLIQIANFLFLLFLMNILLYRPIRGMLAQRDQEVNSLENTIRDYTGRSEETEKSIEEGMISKRKEGYAEKEVLKGQALEEEKGILQEATSSVEEKIGKARSEMNQKIEEVRNSLEDQIAGFSKEFAEKILGRSI